MNILQDAHGPDAPDAASKRGNDRNKEKEEKRKRKTGREEEMCDVGHKATESYGDSPVPQVR